MDNEEKPPRGPLTSEVELEFGGELRTFKLSLRWIDALQQKRNVGLGMIAYRVSTHHWYAEDITETLFYGLVGGGMTAHDARKVVNTWCDGLPLAGPEPDSPLKTAQVVLAAVFFGVDPEDIKPVGKDTAATQMDGSTSRPSMDKDSPSDSPSQPLQVYLSENGSPVELNMEK